MSDQKSPPPVLYHYTNSVGLEGIFREKGVWGSHARYLNDAHEMSHAYGLVAETCSVTGGVAKQVLDLLFRFLETVAGLPMVACFCSNGDSLGQWREYGRSGYAVGFDFMALRKNCETAKAQNWTDAVLRSIVYDPSEQLDRARSGVQKSRLSEALKYLSDRDDIGVADLSQVFSRCDPGGLVDLLTEMLFMKHESFESEQEWRLAQFVPSWNCEEFSRVKFRHSNLGLVPRITFKLREGTKRNDTEDSHCGLPIISVKVGPGPDQDLRRAAVFEFVQSRGCDLSLEEMGGSTIPLR